MTKKFDQLNLNPTILKAIQAKGYTTPTPIQAQSIPTLLEGNDLLGIAQTGTGKTAAFSIPIIHRFAANKKKTKPARMRCLILTPTRELASQIEMNVKEYGKGLAINSTVIFGGVSPRPQIMKMSKGVQILIATPGRLLDLMDQGHIIFDQLETFVLDEADRMLDMGFMRDVQKIIDRLPKKKQTLLFSATMPKDIEALAKKLLKQGTKKVEVTPESTTVERIDQVVNFVERTNKPLLLKAILKNEHIKSMLVFSRTKHGADRIVRHLEKAGVTAAAIHGNKSQGARERALGNFRKGTVRVLVATDIAARGIDIPHIGYIVNYNLPEDPKSYVHRIGRTARAGRKGIAISFCDDSEKKYLKLIEKQISMKIRVDDTHEYHGVTSHQAVKEKNDQGAAERKRINDEKSRAGQKKSKRRRRQTNKKASNK